MFSLKVLNSDFSAVNYPKILRKNIYFKFQIISEIRKKRHYFMSPRQFLYLTEKDMNRKKKHRQFFFIMTIVKILNTIFL